MQNVGNESGKSKTSAPWFKCFPKDWREGTRSLSPEHRGIYMDCLCLIYERDAPLPADDKWMSHALHISVRAWRNAVSALARSGKLLPLQDGWTNSRADEERLKRRSIADQNAIIAQSREDQKRKKSKKENENNKAAPPSVPRTEHHAGACQSLESRVREEDSKPATVEQDAEGSELACLNGSRFEMIETMAVWMSPYAPDKRAAERWLQTAVGLHTAPILQRAFGELRAKISQGDVIARPIPLLNKICERLKSEPAKAAAPAKYVPTMMGPLPDPTVEEAARAARVKRLVDEACNGVRV